MRQLFAIILFIALLILSTVFALNNNQPIVVDYLFGESELALSTLIFWVALIGLLLGILAMTIALLKLRVQLKRCQNRLSKAEQELKNLRTAPVKDTV
ncbi:lipopolysaccharide assembly protein LapA domain-containing protein [Kangiella aquimarina]|uniref:Probable lipopolysaccharide assembly protein A n=1 Tax=Kangiella aquimarina TaxID=261965 RepID=A0ABZ0X2Q9_9GAMM|nr:lipopolysaccharide assembly protein LapA domain-containing protein [Kangiella aquimarina]WQG84825.1 LapA family protein [Kangiella aquimarina]